MAYEVKMPKFGETMTEGTIFKWFKREGEEVKKGDPLFQIETDKSTLDVEAQAEGILAKIIVGKEETVPIGEVVAVIAEEGEEIDDKYLSKDEMVGEKDAGVKAAGEDRIDKNVQDKSGSQKSKEKIINISGKVKASPAARRLAREHGLDLTKIEPQGGREAVVIADVEAYLKKEKLPQITPVARKMAAEYDIDLSNITGTGPGGRITRKDIEAYLDARIGEASAKKISGKKKIPLEGIRKVIAERMSLSYREAPHVTLTTKVDMSEIIKLKKKLQQKTEQHITYTDILIMVTARGLREYPELNRHLKDDHLIAHEEVDIGIAVDSERGLVVPVIKNAAAMGLKEIAESRERLVRKARQAELEPDEMTGSTFTLTNLGNFDIEIFTPIINPPEVAILGIGKIKEEPVVVEGEIKIRPVIWLSLSFDHRAVDGAPAARFLKWIKNMLEEPDMLLL